MACSTQCLCSSYFLQLEQAALSRHCPVHYFDQRIHAVDMRHPSVSQAAQFDHGANRRVDFRAAASLKALSLCAELFLLEFGPVNRMPSAAL